MVNRKRPIILRCPVTAEERSLIEQKMAQLQTKRIGAYLRKMAIVNTPPRDGHFNRPSQTP